MNSIKQYSPHLSFVLARAFPQEALVLFDDAFDAAVKANGMVEEDFEREEGASFNPRPARIALILINDGKVREVNTIASGIIFPSEQSIETNSNKHFSALPEKILEVRNRARDLLQNPESYKANESQAAATVVLASWLDRMRHLRIATAPLPAKSRDDLLQRTEKILTQFGTANSGIAFLLEVWMKRTLR